MDIAATFAEVAFASLEKMDQEATTLVNGYVTGLCDYGGHLGIKVKQYEVPIYRRLAELLNEHGYSAETDVKFPTGGQKCDVVVEVAAGEKTWLEVKMAWKEWFSNRKRAVATSSFYRSYLLGPKAGLERDHSAAQDFEKLEQIRTADGTSVAFLLIGLESQARPMDSEIVELERDNDLPARGWRRFVSAPIMDRNRSDCRIRNLLWWRDIPNA